MSRQQLLFKLLEKAEKGNQYVYSQFCQLTQSRSPPASIKRMQILQMGSCKINAPIPKHEQELIFQKHSSVNNKRVFVLQRVKNATKEQESIKNTLSKQATSAEPKYCSTPVHSTDKRSIENVKTECDSPLRHNAGIKKTISVSESVKNSHSLKKDMQTVKSEKHCLFKSTEMTNDSKGPEHHQTFKRKLSNTSRIINKGGQGSFYNHKQQEKRVKIEIRKQVNKNYQKAFTPPPKITAKSFIVYEISNNAHNAKPDIHIHTAYNSKIRVQIASLTKIMTCIVAIQICTKLGLKPNQEEVKIGKFESAIGGTSANVQINDIYTVHDLLHGLMLPSGNDASLALAVWGGKKLLQKKQLEDGQIIPRKKMKKQCYNRFIQQMNAKSFELDLTKTTYANSHGLINLLNRSCAHDIAVLSHYCMKNQYFCSIVSCRNYSKKIRVETKIRVQVQNKQKAPVPAAKDQNNEEDLELSDMDSETESQVEDKNENKQEESTMFEQKIIVSERQIAWENTHRLLHKSPDEYIGIKTGVTTAAGPCLSSCVVTPCGRKIFIVVLNCKKLQMRFKETQILKKWVFKKQGIYKKIKSQIGSKSTKSEVDLSDKQQSQSLEDPETALVPYD